MKLTSISENKTTPVELIKAKSVEYYRAAVQYRFLYYAFRLIAGLSAALLPFIIAEGGPTWLSIGLSISIAVVTVFDTVLVPKDRWVLYSKATDVLGIAMLKLDGTYETYKDALAIIVATEDAAVQQVIGLKELLDRVHEVVPAAVPAAGKT